jgi:hypothetical protein
MNHKPFIHPNCPRKLAAAFHFARNAHGEGYKIRVLEQKLGVNFKYLVNMIRKGIEPNDTTEKLRAVRKAMFLPARKRKARTVIAEKRETAPEHIKWWRKQPKSLKESYIKDAYEFYIHPPSAFLPR